MNDKTTTALVLTILTVAWLGAAVAQDTAARRALRPARSRPFRFLGG